MNVYGFHSIKHPESKKLANAIVEFCIIEIPDILSINIIGSSVNKLVLTNQQPKSDIDFVILREKEFDYKKINIDLEKLNAFLIDRQLVYNILYNGIKHIGSKTDNSLDLILQSLNELMDHEPHIVFDVARRNRIHIYGRDFYKNLEKIEMSFSILSQRIQMTRNYISRETQRKESGKIDWPIYIAKSAILNTSYLFIDHYNTVSKHDIYEYSKKNYPLISDDIEFLFRVYSGEADCDLDEMIEFNNKYGEKLLRTYKLNNV